VDAAMASHLRWDCKDIDQIHTHLLGDVRAGGHLFSVFDLNYSLMPRFPGGVYHGGRFLLVHRDGRYWGRLTGIEDLVPKVVDNSVILSASEDAPSGFERPKAIHFAASGPPHLSFVSGQFVYFER
jgi:hypothetical protein